MRRHRTDHSLKATVLGEEESHNHFLAVAHLSLNPFLMQAACEHSGALGG